MSVYLFLRRNLLLILIVLAIVACGLFAASLVLLNKYTAVATIIVDPRTPNVTQGASVLPNIGSDAIAIESLVQATKSPSFVGRIVDKLHLANDGEFGDRDAAIEKLTAQLDISRRGTTYVIDAIVNNRSPQKGALIANAAAQEIIDSQQSLHVNTDDQIAGDIKGRLADVRGRLTQAEQAVAAMRADLKVTNVGQGQTLLERRVYELNQQLVLTATKTANARARLQQLQGVNANAAADSAPANESAVLINLRAEYARLQRQAADQAAVLGPRHPAVASLNAQIADAKRQITAEIARKVSAARADLAESQQQEDLLAHELQAAQQESGNLGSRLVKLGELEQEARATRSVYDQLLLRQKELTETKNLVPNDVRFVSRAMPPDKLKPGLALRLAASLAFGLVAGIGYALVREMLFAPLATAAQVQRVTGHEVAGWAPLLRAGKTAGSKKDERGIWRAPGEEELPDLTPWVADLCSLLTPGAVRGRPPVMLITSALAGTGRSTIAANCARYFAAGGSRVLLVEADRPAGANTSEPFGLIDVLDGDEDPQDTFIESDGEGYTILPFGGRFAEDGPSASSLMSGASLGQLFKSCRRWFDIIIIDGPAALEGAHAPLLGRQSDLAVLVAAWNKTTPADAREAIERLGNGDPVIFFNKVDMARLPLFDPAQSRWIATMAEEAGRTY